jgi:hypothetical protein
MGFQPVCFELGFRNQGSSSTWPKAFFTVAVGNAHGFESHSKPLAEGQHHLSFYDSYIRGSGRFPQFLSSAFRIRPPSFVIGILTLDISPLRLFRENVATTTPDS